MLIGITNRKQLRYAIILCVHYFDKNSISYHHRRWLSDWRVALRQVALLSKT